VFPYFSWGSGANPWGPEKEDQFSKPNHWDGMLEVVGVTGVVHLGQIQSGFRSALRIAQVRAVQPLILKQIDSIVPWCLHVVLLCFHRAVTSRFTCIPTSQCRWMVNPGSRAQGMSSSLNQLSR
jgi:hypothetical protein